MHTLHFPAWWSYLRQHHFWWLAVCFILAVAAWVRLVDIGRIPVGMSWDEAALGYVGRMVVTTGRDEHGALLPRVFQSFGDYKAPLAFYITGVSTTLFGLHPWAVRLPFALAGVATVALFIWIGRQLFPSQPWLGLLAGSILAVLPWQWLFSRVAFESGLALFFYAAMIGSWLHLRRQTQSKPGWWGLLVLSGVAGLYVYHSARLVFPLAVVLILWHEWLHHRSWLRQQIRPLLLILTVGLVLLMPLGVAIVWQNGAARAAQTTVFSQSLQPWSWGPQLLHNLVVHLDWQFLVQGETTTLRHSTGSRGVLLYSQFVFFIIGITIAVGLTMEKWLRSARDQKWLSSLYQAFHHPAGYQAADTAPWLWLGLFGIGLLPAIIGWEVPHANRALLATLPMIVLMVEGVRFLRHEWPNNLFPLVTGSLVLAMMLEGASFWNFYRTDYRLRSAAAWLDGYPGLVEIVIPWQRAGKTIKIDSSYGQPQIFFGFWEHTPAASYRAGQISHVTFGDFDPINDPLHFDIVVLSSDLTWPSHLPQYQIMRADGAAAFSIYEITHQK